MNLLKLNREELQIAPNRQRKEFDAQELSELRTSIANLGLFHPIVVRESEGKFVLVAGERRLRAIDDLSMFGKTVWVGTESFEPGTVPCISIGDLSPLEAMEAELDENIKRSDLTWQERAEATAKLKALRDAQAADRGEPPVTVAAIALEITGSTEGAAQDDRRKELLVAKHLEDPEVKAAPSLREAFKVLKAKEIRKENEKRAADIGAVAKTELHSLQLGDAVEWLAAAAADQFDVICTDPPYGMGADAFGDAGGRLVRQTHEYVDDEQTFARTHEALLIEGFRICKPQAHIYICCDLDRFHFIRNLAEKVGWKPFRTPLVNFKLDGNRAPWPQNGPQRKYELIFYAVKGNRPVTSMYGDVISTRGDENLGHGAQKPVALYTDLLRRSVRPGDRVLDPFCGTGTIFPAAHSLNCRATGVELDPAAYGIAANRLGDLS